jgi:hypothetical protein
MYGDDLAGGAVRDMKRAVQKNRTTPERETLTEAYEVRAFRDEPEEPKSVEAALSEVPHAAAGALQAVKKTVKGHGEQTILPDDCQFSDNDLCYVDA